MKTIALPVSADEIRSILANDTADAPGEIERPITPQPDEFQPGYYLYDGNVYIGEGAMADHLFHDVYDAQYGAAYAGGYADLLSLRETWAIVYESGESVGTPDGTIHFEWLESVTGKLADFFDDDSCPAVWWIAYRADFSAVEADEIQWRPSTAMPAWVSRGAIVNDGVYAKRNEDGVWVWVIQYRRAAEDSVS